jgi:hypothetical protein
MERGAETHRPCSNTEQIHCKAGREKLTLLQRAKGLLKSQVGARATKSLRRSEAIPSTLAHVVKPRAGSTSHIVRLCHTLSSDWSSGGGKRSGMVRSCGKIAIPGIFHVEGSSWVQKVLL